ncbi:MAG TPA: Bax inhibitor-1/YccA family protein [Rhizomicrobium sp.]|nr:Bax inhibitor-1/YccA family protein [Rhizomicrobium sp.]
MADFDNRALSGRSRVADGAIDQGLRAYMLRVYNYMFVGLVLTGLAAKLTSAAAVVDTGHGLVLTQLGRTLYTSPLAFVIMLAPLAFLLVLSFGLQRMSAATAQIVFWTYAAITGVSLSAIFLVYTGASIAQVFFITAAAFGALSLWGYTTKTDLTAMGSFLIMGVFGLFIAMLVNIFLNSALITWVTSVVGVGIFAGLTAYDTQYIKNMYYEGDDGSTAAKKAIRGALYLYLDFLNMFLFLLRLMGNRR